MEAKYKSISIPQFYHLFPNNEACLRFLVRLKWADGFQCPKCGHHKFCNGHKPFSRQCTVCRYIESPTANTLFHKVKFSLHKAFTIVYFVATNKKGISSTELSRKLQLRQKTCWLFRQKTLQAMKSMSNTQLHGMVELINFEIGKKKIIKDGQSIHVKKHIALAIEQKGKGVSRVYAKQIDNLGYQEINAFIQRFIHPEATVLTNAWPTYSAIRKKTNTQICCHAKKKQLALAYRVKNSLLAWLKGMHGHAEWTQYYLDEFTFRFNRNRLKEEIFYVLLKRMVQHPPRRYLDLMI